MFDRGHRVANHLEIWAARTWNVFNEGRPFYLVFWPMALAAALLLGVGPRAGTVDLLIAIAVIAPLVVVQAAFQFPLRWRALLWAVSIPALALLEFWQAVGVMAVAISGYIFFTVFFWGTLYYHLRTGAPLTNFLRFWRLVATNSDPTSANALEQIPKMLITLSALSFVAEEPTDASALKVGAVTVALYIAGLIARSRVNATMPVYPPPASASLRGISTGEQTSVGFNGPSRISDLDRPAQVSASSRPAQVSASSRPARVSGPGRPVRAPDPDRPARASSEPVRPTRAYVIVIDGLNRDRLRQANTPTLDRLIAEGSEYLDMQTAHPARTVVCFSSMLTGATPREHGMRSNFAPRLGVRCESIFDVLTRHGKGGRLVGIAHLIDPFGEKVVRSVSSIQPTQRIDHSLVAAAREVVEAEDPELLVLQLLAVDQIGHVRGVRNPEYLKQIEETDRHIDEFLGFLRDRGKLEDAAVIILADHGQGRGVGGHGHMDWGENPVPYIHWGAGARPGTVVRERRSILELAMTLAELMDIPAPARARGRSLLDAGFAEVGPPAGARCLAMVPALNEEGPLPGVLATIPATACGVPVDRLVIDDGSSDGTVAVARAAGADVVSHQRTLGLGAAVRSGLEYAREHGYSTCVYLDGDGEYDGLELERLAAPVIGGRADYVTGSRFMGRREGMSWHRTLANRLTSSLLATLCRTVISDGQTGYRAFSQRAIEAAEIIHDYNYAQVLTMGLTARGMPPFEVPISYRRRRDGRSFVHYPTYARRVLPAMWRQWRTSRNSTVISTTPRTPVTTNGSTEPGS